MKLALAQGTHKAVRCTREDGMQVFVDGDAVVDNIRRTGSREEVIIAVALRRAQQVAMDYARNHAPDLLGRIEEIITGANPLVISRRENNTVHSQKQKGWTMTAAAATTCFARRRGGIRITVHEGSNSSEDTK